MDPQGLLRLDRFCGRELYAIERAEVYVSLPGEGEVGIVLNLEFHCGAAIQSTTSDEARSMYSPSVEVNIPIASLAPAALVGKTVRVAESLNRERDTWNRIYVYEHEDLRDMTASFLEIAGKRCRLWLTGHTQDPNHYDGSKPETVVRFDGWFPVAKLKDAARRPA